MAAEKPPRSGQPRPEPASRSSRHSLLWPVVATVLGALLIHNALQGQPESKQQTRPVAVAPAAPRATATTKEKEQEQEPLRRSAPTRLSIPRIAVDAPFTPLSVDEGGQLEAPPPDDNNLVGWYRGGASPGERGSAIVVGHVDTKTGPAVFARLSLLKPGSMVHISRADGTVASFQVDSVDTFSKADFPDEQVYGDTSSPQLRLITCAGNYNRSTREYEENMVVFAHLASSRRS